MVSEEKIYSVMGYGHSPEDALAHLQEAKRSLVDRLLFGETDGRFCSVARRVCGIYDRTDTHIQDEVLPTIAHLTLVAKTVEGLKCSEAQYISPSAPFVRRYKIEETVRFIRG